MVRPMEERVRRDPQAAVNRAEQPPPLVNVRREECLHAPLIAQTRGMRQHWRGSGRGDERGGNRVTSPYASSPPRRRAKSLLASRDRLHSLAPCWRRLTQMPFFL